MLPSRTDFTYYADGEPYCGPCTQLGQDSQCYSPADTCKWLVDSCVLAVATGIAGVRCDARGTHTH